MMRTEHDLKRKTPNYLQKLELELELQNERARRQQAEQEAREHARDYDEIYKLTAEYETKIEEAEVQARTLVTEAGRLRRMLNTETKRANLNDWHIQQAEEKISNLELTAFAQRQRAAELVKQFKLRIHHGEAKTKRLGDLVDKISADLSRYKEQAAESNKEWSTLYERLQVYAGLFVQGREEIIQRTQRLQGIIELSEEAMQNRARLLQMHERELDSRRVAVNAQLMKTNTMNDIRLVVDRVTKNRTSKPLAVKEREKRLNMERAKVNLWQETRNTRTFWTDYDSSASESTTVESVYDFQFPHPAKQMPDRMTHPFDVPWASHRIDGVFDPPWPQFSPPVTRMASLNLSDSDMEMLSPLASDTDMLSVSEAVQFPRFIIHSPAQSIQRKRVRFTVPEMTGLGGRNEVERPSLPKRRRSDTDIHPLSNPPRRIFRHPPLNRVPGKTAIRKFPSRAAIRVEFQYHSSIQSGGTRQVPLSPASAAIEPSEPPPSQEATLPMPTRKGSPSPPQQLIGHQYFEDPSQPVRSQTERVTTTSPRSTSPVLQPRGVRKVKKKHRRKDSSSLRRERKTKVRKKMAPPTLPMPMPGMWPESPFDEYDATKLRPLGHVSESLGGRLSRFIQRRGYQLVGGLVIFGTLLYACVGHQSHHKWMVYNDVPSVVLSKLRNSPTSVIGGSTALDFNIMSMFSQDRAKLG
ncbi:hypothetical protein N7520_000276 [Penicillium odoratum]|uniref:uncharacterized protein n=1 Tax=Penicillium odoratum TaxID=1167516 RepID=UPI0025467CBF|nr:uncharacterized protein N7520_000276 [Penicillium odoratum]KAJ5777030.1 hypothetical protein N7520_000276 [Penicillium odoratum]